MPDKIRVLFVCRTNAGASQMAEAILKSLAPERFEAFSAGLTPVPAHPMSEEVMRHIDIDLSQAESKPVSAFADQSFDLVVTIGDDTADWPQIAGAEHLHWDIPDPLLVGGHMEDIMQAFMTARHDVYQHVQSLVAAFGPEAGTAES